MHVSEMRRREPFADVLARTLTAGWTAEYGESVSVAAGAGAGQVWKERRPFSAYTVAGAARPCRLFLRDSFRFTPVRRRMPAQWVLGTVAATAVGLRLGAGEAFTVTPAIPDAEQKLVLPGNLRIRVFDFKHGIVRVLAKQGFSKKGIQRDIDVRTGMEKGPFPPILRHDIGAGWFEEAILDAAPLPRVPSKRRRQEAMKAALVALDAWSTPTLSEEDARQRVEGLLDRLDWELDAVKEAYGWACPQELRRSIGRLGLRASQSGTTKTAVGHGDMQPGNIMIDGSGQALIIDWEHSDRRLWCYDHMVAGLAGRTPTGIGKRIQAYVEDGAGPTFLPLVESTYRRAQVASMFALEDLLWYAEECNAGPMRVPSRGFLQYVQELPLITAVVAKGTG